MSWTEPSKTAEATFAIASKSTDTFSEVSKSSEASFALPSKNNATWTNAVHSDEIGGGFDVQTFDNGAFDEAITIVTNWAIKPKT